MWNINQTVCLSEQRAPTGHHSSQCPRVRGQVEGCCPWAQWGEEEVSEKERVSTSARHFPAALSPDRHLRFSITGFPTKAWKNAWMNNSVIPIWKHRLSFETNLHVIAAARIPFQIVWVNDNVELNVKLSGGHEHIIVNTEIFAFNQCENEWRCN